MIDQIKWFLSCMDKKDKPLLRRWLLLSLILTGLDFLNIYLLLRLTDGIRSELVGSKTILLTIAMGFTVLVSGVLSFVGSKLGVSLRNSLRNSFSAKMYRLYCSEELLLHNDRTFSQVLTNIRFDCESCCGVFILLLQNCIQLVVWVLYAAVLIVRIGWIGLGVAAALLLTSAFVIVRNKRKMISCGDAIRNSRIYLNTLVGTSYGAYKELKIDTRREKLQTRYENACDENAEMELSYASAVRFISQAIKTLITAGVYFGLAVLLLTDTHATSLFATVILLISTLTKLVPLTASMISVINQYNSNHMAFTHLREDSERYTELLAQEETAKALRKKELSFREGITVKDLSFSYPNGKMIFDHVSFFFPKGKKIAVIGASGAGKTTLIDLLLGLLHPSSGSICYDDYDIVSQSDAQGRCTANLGDIVSYVTQTVYLHGGTVRDNITFLSDSEDEEKLTQCLSCADILRDIQEMPGGIDTVLGENGVSISGGQRQRLALARALYKDFEILVMDEATAALDDETERAVMETLGTLQKGKTLLMVTHHMSLVEQCDIVYEVKNHQVLRIK